MAEEKVRLPIKVVFPQEQDYYKPPAGGGERKIFDKNTDKIIDSLTSQIHVLDDFFKPSFRKFPDAPAVAKVILKKEAIAKSHRPDSPLNRNTCPIFGAGGFGELFVSVKREGLKRLGENIRALRSKTSIADISTIDRIEPYQVSDTLNYTNLEEFQEFLYSTKKPKPLKLRLFRHRDPHLNDCLIEAFRQQLDELGLKYPKEIYYDEGMSIYKITEIAEYLGFQVEYLNSMNDRHSAIIYPEKMLIGINGRHHPHCQRFSLSHELGHHLLRHPPELELSQEDAKVCNREADEFSGELLVPLELLKKALKITKDLHELSDLFNVSRDVVTIRLINQKLLK